jgi:hypothetical protein
VKASELITRTLGIPPNGRGREGSLSSILDAPFKICCPDAFAGASPLFDRPVATYGAGPGLGRGSSQGSRTITLEIGIRV